MPRYFFQVSTDDQPDKEGVEFANDDQAARAGVELAGVLLQEEPTLRRRWSVHVIDEAGSIVSRVKVSVDWPLSQSTALNPLMPAHSHKSE